MTPKILPGPVQPYEVESQHHMVNHLSPAPWCEPCVTGRGKDDPHLRSDLREKGEQLPVIAFDFAFVKTTSASGETEQKIATTLVAVDADLFFFRESHSPFWERRLLTTVPPTSISDLNDLVAALPKPESSKTFLI